jgi:hypothetical protein
VRKDTLQRLAFPAAALVVVLLVLVLRPPQEESAAGLARVEPLRPARAVPAAEADAGAEPAAAARAFTEAMDHYDAGRWAAAEARLDEAIAAGGPDWKRAGEARLYRGSCRLLAGRAEEARADLQAAAADTAQSVSVRGKWYLAQAHLLLDDVGAARPLLDELSRTPAYARPASEELLLLRGR